MFPVTFNIGHFQVVDDEATTSIGDLAYQLVVVPGKFDQGTELLLRCVTRNRNVMNPRLHSRIEKLDPFVAHVKHERIAEEKVLEPETCRYSPIVEQIFVRAMIFKRNFLGRWSRERIL